MFNSSPQLGAPVTSENRFDIGIRIIFLPSMPCIVGYPPELPRTGLVDNVGFKSMKVGRTCYNIGSETDASPGRIWMHYFRGLRWINVKAIGCMVWAFGFLHRAALSKLKGLHSQRSGIK